MDFGNIIYIIAVIVYFIYTATQSKKKKQAEARQDETDADEKPQPERGISFEDLLKEIREAQSPPKPVAEKPRAVPVVPVPEEKAEVKPVRTRRYEENDDEIKYYEGAYEKIKKQEERLDELAATIPSQKPSAYDLRQKQRNRYAEILKNKKSVREAIVLNEILGRRHF